MNARSMLLPCVLALVCIGVADTLKADDDAARVASLERSSQVNDDSWSALLAQGDLAEDLVGERHPGIVASVRDLIASLGPAPESKREQAREQSHQSAQALDEFLNGWKTSGEGWKKYLRLSELLDQTAAKPSETTLEAMRSLQNKFDNASLDAKYRVAFDRPAFQEAAQALGRYVSVLEPPDAERHRRLVSQLQLLLGAIQALDDPQDERPEAVVRQTADALATSSVPEEAALGSAVRQAYLAPNLRLQIGAGLLQKFVGPPRDDHGPVREWLGGAEVVGTQTTHTTPHFELDPSENNGSFSLVLSGTSRSTTTAYKSPARIYGGSFSRFGARKQVWVTADGLQPRPARVNVAETHNTISDADTDIGGLFAGIARSTAIDRATAKLPEAEALAERRVRERVSRRLDAEVDGAVAQINERWNGTLAPLLTSNGLSPKYVASRSTSQALMIDAELLYSNQLAASSAAPSLPEGALMAVYVHESAVNNALDQMQLGGTTVEAKELQTRLRAALAPILDPNVLGPEQDDALQGSITFAEQQPLRVHFSGGRVEIVLRAASFHNAGVEVPAKTVVASYKLDLHDGRLALARDDELEISSPESGSAVVAASFQSFLAAKDAAVNAALRMRLDHVFRSPLELPASFTVTTHTGEQVSLALSHAEAQDGWLTIAIR